MKSCRMKQEYKSDLESGLFFQAYGAPSEEDAGGFVFYTNFNSRKNITRHLSNN